MSRTMMPERASSYVPRMTNDSHVVVFALEDTFLHLGELGLEHRLQSLYSEPGKKAATSHRQQ